MGTKYQLIQTDNGFSVTTTEEDENGKPLQGTTEQFNTQDEAEAYMSKQTDKPQATTPIDNNTITEDELNQQNATGTDDQGKEKPASQMTEADAVALNSDVHVATPSTSPRLVTDGQVEQTEAGLHPDATEGKPLMHDDGTNNQQKVEPAEDLHVRESSNK